MSRELNLRDDVQSRGLAAFHIKNFLEVGFNLPNNFRSLEILGNMFLEERDSSTTKEVEPIQRKVFIVFLRVVLDFHRVYPKDKLHSIFNKIKEEHVFLTREEFDKPQ